MAYGGGTWLSQNKILPGSYINFTSRARASATLSDRGVAAAPFALPWGPVGTVRLIEQGEFLKDSFDLFGYEYSDDAMLALREIFKHAIKVYCYRLQAEGAATAKVGYAAAKYPGTRGNDIRILIDNDPDVTGGYVVTTMVGAKTVDTQKVAAFAELANNDWVTWTKHVTAQEAVDGSYVLTEDTALNPEKTYYTRTGEEGSYTYSPVETPDVQDIATYYEQVYETVTRYFRFTAETAESGKQYTVVSTTAGTALTGGADGTVSSGAHQAFLEAIEPFAFNTLCCPVSDEDQTTIGLYVTTTKNMRDKIGAKFQTVCCKPTNADYEGVIGVWNDATHSTIEISKGILAYWVTGAECAANINESLTNTKYDGELTINVNIKQSALEQHIEQGHLVAHNNNGDVVILTDINSLVTLKENFGSIFQKNQTVRVCDQIGNDIARLFNRRYLGIVQNDATGRDALWNDIVYYFRELERLRAITEFEDEQVTVEIGSQKDAVLVTLNGVNVVNAMEKLYMAVMIQ